MTGIQSLRSHGLPTEIDRSAWSMSGADKSAMLGALKFLGLIDSAGQTQEALRQLIKAEQNTDEEKKFLITILRQRYSEVFDLDLTSATPLHVSDAIGSYGPTGSTKHRAIRFFLKAVTHRCFPTPDSGESNPNRRRRG